MAESASPETNEKDQAAAERYLARRKHRRRPHPVLAFGREYLLELVAALLAVLGVFLLFEQMDIRATLFRWLVSAADAIGIAVQVGVGRIRAMALSDIAGVILIIAALVFAVWRVRWRLMHSSSLLGRDCPVCGGYLRRTHRQFLDRVISVFVPMARYRCSNQDCRWSGLRIRRYEH